MNFENQAVLSAASVVRVGPAKVIERSGLRVRLEFEGSSRWAVIALGYFYKPQVGDVVLALSQDAECYIVGILAGSGAINLTAPGDLTISAPRGDIRLVARNRVHLQGGYVSVVAETLEMTARSVLERFTCATRWVKEAFQLRVGRLRSDVKGDCRFHTERFVVDAKADVKIDGDRISLG